ncbi:hypothetical protein [Anaeromyxobacter sp. SG17]|uniref:hypothetical protein n=1 Tax=Anaeromyxobacter sp. SG17 TaxID=2925405 RepID=UPI001F5ADC77|nr:hypothetical protein [Anaeromyxobacter sp. SG17]
MALYRFLFAPALLALAVLAGPGREQGPATQAEPPRVVAPERAATAPAPQPQGSLSRAVAKHAPRNPARPARR